jgi:hypothetical protein
MTRSTTLLVAATLVLIGVVARVLPHVPNFAPVTATALFCGAYLDRRQSFVVLTTVVLLSDYLLLYLNPYGTISFNHIYAPWELYHQTLPYVYGSFAVSGLVGMWLRWNRTPGSVVTAALFCSIQFFLITNAAVWLVGAYDRGINGLWQSYVAGIPFFKGTLMGDLLYTCAFFGLYEMMQRSQSQRVMAPDYPEVTRLGCMELDGASPHTAVKVSDCFGRPNV